MPFKSKAQERKMRILEKQGKIKEGTCDEWQDETGKKKLPEHIKKKTQKVWK